MSTLRTVDTISRRLITGMSGMKIGAKLHHPYLICRHNPFNGLGGSGIPDGNNSSFIVTDLYAYDTINVATGNPSFSIQTMPAMPCSAFLAASGAMLVNGLPYGAGDIASPDAVSLTAAGQYKAFVPLGVPTQWPYKNIGTGSTTVGGGVSDPFNSSKARIVALAYRLIYTGPAYDCAGSITITPNSVSFQPVGAVTTGSAPTTTTTGIFTENQVGTKTQLANGTNVLSLDYTFAPNTFTRESVTIRPEQGLLLVPKHSTTDFKILPIYDVPYALVQNDGIQSTGAVNSNTVLNILKSVPGYSGAVVFYDNDWSGYTINFSGLNPDASFRWETVYCVEYSPNGNSAFKSLTKTREQSLPNVIKDAENNAATTPEIRVTMGKNEK